MHAQPNDLSVDRQPGEAEPADGIRRGALPAVLRRDLALDGYVEPGMRLVDGDMHGLAGWQECGEQLLDCGTGGVDLRRDDVVKQRQMTADKFFRKGDKVLEFRISVPCPA